jgi:uncharacterized protein YndB with AHSA1/START domain
LVTNSNIEWTLGIVTASEKTQERSNMSVNEMTTRALEPEALNDFTASSSEVFASVKIEAEVQRILYALSTPEYMEAWLHFPGAERVECHSELRSFDRFRIDMFLSNKKLASIYGSCLLSKPKRVTYLWDKDSVGISYRSVVEIHILGGPNRCALKLNHRGLSNVEDREWHSTMWQQSLSKLRILMERIEFEKVLAFRDKAG